MRVLVVGLGSMGKRRIRLIKLANPNAEITGVDLREDRRKFVKETYGINTCSELDKALDEKYSCGFVCTSPLSHVKIIGKLLAADMKVFTELNAVSDGYEELIRECKNGNLFLSSTLLYRKDIQYIQERVKDKVVNYIYHTGQYLPDWHPWENYQDFFVGDRKTNGCREIMAIDFPWIFACFGKIKRMQVMKSKMSQLNIAYNDNYMIQFEHENGSKGTVVVDVVSRKATRRLEVFSETVHLTWGNHENPTVVLDYDVEQKNEKQVYTYDTIEKDQKYCENIIENAYLEEIHTFFAMLGYEADKKVMYTFEDDLYTLEVIDEIEKY